MEEYKSILWLDDLNEININNSTPTIKVIEDCIKRRFGSLCENNLIHHIQKYSEAINAVTSDCQYDCVVFDMDWKNADIKIHSDELQNHGVIVNIPKNINELHITEKEFFTERAGAYLYQLLLLHGYPSDRMIILTNNEFEIPERFLSEAGFNANTLNMMKKEDINNENPEWSWDQFFQGDYFYYRIRRLVFQACEYWKSNMEKKAENIAFNKIYFSKDSDSPVSVESFKEILERIELLFPVVKPENPERVYYHAMQIISMIHEKNAEISKAKGVYKPYHSMIRNFRNWSSHNRFEKTELDGEQFALLFCIALRTMFDECSDNKLSPLYSYEKIFDFSCNYEELDEDDLPEEIDFKLSKNDLNKKLDEIFKELYKINIDKSNGKNISDAMFLKGTLSNMIYQIPQNLREYWIEKKYLFMNLWCASNKIELSITINKKETNLIQPFQIIHNWNCPVDECEKICDLSQGDSPEALFMRYCYRWI